MNIFERYWARRRMNIKNYKILKTINRGGDTEYVTRYSEFPFLWRNDGTYSTEVSAKRNISNEIKWGTERLDFEIVSKEYIDPTPDNMKLEKFIKKL